MLRRLRIHGMRAVSPQLFGACATATVLALLTIDGRAVAQSTRLTVGLSPAGAPYLTLAQTSPSASLSVPASIDVKPGTSMQFAIKVGQEARAANLFVMLHRVPEWITIKGAEAVGTGVWLVPAAQVDTAEVVVAAAASGEHTVRVALLAADGKVAREADMKLLAPAKAAQPGGVAKTWEDLTGAQTKAAAASPPPAAPARPAQVAQAAPQAKGPPAAAAAAAKSEAQLVDYARYLVRECTTCHSLYGDDVGIPLMIGLSRDRFIDTMRLYATGRRDHPPMQSVAQALNEEETLALALYLGRIRPPTPVAASTGAGSAATAGSPPQGAPKATSTESADRIARWIKRGEDLIAAGEIVQARLMLERASEAGNARAAYLLGTSYDPNTLPWRPGIGLEAEPRKAREWYLYAQRLGAGTEAAQRLADLPAPR